MTEVGLVLLGAALSLVATFLVERWKLIKASQTAATLMVKELELHEQKLNLVAFLDQNPNAEYVMKFPSPVWTAHSSSLLAGSRLRDAEAILNWYASLTVFGFELTRQIRPEGPQLSGPDRPNLQMALNNAHAAAERLASRGVFRKRAVRLSPTLFPPRP